MSLLLLFPFEKGLKKWNDFVRKLSFFICFYSLPDTVLVSLSGIGTNIQLEVCERKFKQ